MPATIIPSTVTRRSSGQDSDPVRRAHLVRLRAGFSLREPVSVDMTAFVTTGSVFCVWDEDSTCSVRESALRENQ